MEVHVTCGRGTEIFVKRELLAKVNCREVFIEDGKVFFKLNNMDNKDQKFQNTLAHTLFNLKSVERLFATIAHFPTSEIKQSGKVKFLHLLKNKILNGPSLENSAAVVCQLRQLMCLNQIVDTSRFNTSHPSHGHYTTDRPSTKQRVFCHATVSPKGNLCTNSTLKIRTNSSDNSEECFCSTSQDLCTANAEKNAAFQLIEEAKHDVGDDEKNNEEIHLEVEPPAKKAKKLGTKRMECDARLSAIRKRISEKLAGNAASAATTTESACYKDTAVEDITQPRSKKTQNICLANTVQHTSNEENLAESERKLSFRFSVKCGGWCKKWMQPQRLARELGIRLTIMLGWKVDLGFPDIEICVHVNDDFVTVGIPLTSAPLSKRDYILDPGLRSTVSWIMASLADIQPGHIVLDPMCGKATILVEAAKAFPMAPKFVGIDCSTSQLEAAARNVTFAGLGHHIDLMQAEVSCMPFKDNTVDRIVCDAPFGQKFLVASHSLPDFYSHLLTEMFRVLSPSGLAVILTSQELLPIVLSITTQGPWTSRNATLPDTSWSTHDQIPGSGLVLPDSVKTSTACITANTGKPSEHEAAPKVGKKEARELLIGDEKCNRKQAIDVAIEATKMSDETECLVVHKPPVTRIKEFDKLTSGSVNRHNNDDILPSSTHSRINFTMKEERGILSEVGNSMCDIGQSSQLTVESKDLKECERFCLESSHYIKLGETHAYIIVMRKLK